MRYEAKFTPTPDDIVTGYRMRNGQSDDPWKLCAFAAVLIATVFGTAAYLMEFLAIGIVGVVLVPVAFIPAGMEWNIRRMARKWSQEELRFCFSESGVEFSSSTVQSTHAWSLFTKALLDDRGLLLFTDSVSYSFIPARAFTSGSGYFPRQELKSLLSAKLKKA
jgi:hypothetical protein